MTAVKVHAEVTGDRAAPPLVLVNSLGTDLTMWDGQVAALSADHRLVRYDPRGHGRSPAPPGPYTLADLGSDLVALLDRLKIERVIACGISLGGLTALWLTVTHPERVDRLVLANTAARIGTREAWMERARTVRSEGTIAVADVVVDRFLSAGFRTRNSEIATRLRQRLVETDDEGYAACCLALAAADLRSAVTEVQAPVLVIGSTEDVATPPEGARWLHDRLPDSRLQLLEGCGHLSCLERPRAFNHAVLNFLGQEPS